MADRGKLITIEGQDRALVGEQVAQLVQWLGQRGVRSIQTVLPTRGPIGALLRLETQSRLRFDPACLALLRMADRLDLLERKGGILARLQEGCIVLCAHYLWLGEGSVKQEIDPRWVDRINARCARPDLSLYLAVDGHRQIAWPASTSHVVDVICTGEGEGPLNACRQRVAALLWPGEGDP